MPDFVKVATVSDLSDGEIKQVEVAGESVVLARLEGDFYAIGETCTHAEGPLADGYVEDDEVECPWHGSRFSLRTGEVTNAPAVEAVPRYTVRVEGEDVLVAPPDA